MAEIYLVRHAKSYANIRDFTAFNNQESPLIEKGITQAHNLAVAFKEVYGIDPATYEKPILASEYVRPQQTAQIAGFRHIDTSDLLNEAGIEEQMSGTRVIEKHYTDRWAPEETFVRAKRLIGLVRAGELDYEIFFSHGMFIATTLLELKAEADSVNEVFSHEFREGRGYVPDLATIIPVTV